MSHRSLNIDEVADYLHVTKQAIEELVRAREIPHSRQGGRIQFRQAEIDAWASLRILGFSHDDLSDFHRQSSAKTHDLSAGHAILPELMEIRYIDPGLRSKTKQSVIRDLVALAEQTELLNYPEDLLAGIQEREQLCSTALAGGLALLHTAKHEPYMAEDSFIVLGRTCQPIPFGSPDGRTTDLFFLVCAQDDRIHLHLLARLCMCAYHTQLLLDLREAQDAPAMLQALLSAEKTVIQEM